MHSSWSLGWLKMRKFLKSLSPYVDCGFQRHYCWSIPIPIPPTKFFVNSDFGIGTVPPLLMFYWKSTDMNPVHHCIPTCNGLDIIFKIDQTNRACRNWKGTLIFNANGSWVQNIEKWWYSFTCFTDIKLIFHSISFVDGKTCQIGFFPTAWCSNVF